MNFQLLIFCLVFTNYYSKYERATHLSTRMWSRSSLEGSALTWTEKKKRPNTAAETAIMFIQGSKYVYMFQSVVLVRVFLRWSVSVRMLWTTVPEMR